MYKNGGKDNEKRDEIGGIIPAMLTPFIENGEIGAALKEAELIEHSAPVGGYYV